MGIFGRDKKQEDKQASGLAVLNSNLQTEQYKSEIILNAIADGVVVVSPSGVIQSFNQAAATMTGWPVNEAINLDHHSIFTFLTAKGDPFNAIDNPIDRILKERAEIRNNDIILKTRGNTRIELSLILSPVMTQGSGFMGAVGVFRDVTVERSEEKQRAEFISTASHEMRTPVAAIEGYLALAMNNKVSVIDEKARGFLQKAHESTQHLGALFQDLLTAAKSEDGRLVNNPVVVEIGEYISDMANDLRFSAQKKSLHLEYVIGSQGASDMLNKDVTQKMLRPLYYVFVDPERLREVLINLFDNAVKYTEKGTISIGLTGNDQVVQIFVRDTGAGIPSEDLPHLFQKFYRVDNSATRTIGGTGLGLFICRKIIEMYQGRIWVESKIGEGSTFYINLPRLSSEEAEQKKRDAANVISPQHPPTP